LLAARGRARLSLQVFGAACSTHPFESSRAEAC
jgi:hypothetical protein